MGEEAKPAEQAKPAGAEESNPPVEKVKQAANLPNELHAPTLAEGATPADELSLQDEPSAKVEPTEEPEVAENDKMAELEGSAKGIAETRDAHNVPAYDICPKTLLGSAAIPTGKPCVSASHDDAGAHTAASLRRFGLFPRFSRAAAASASFAASLRPRRKATAVPDAPQGQKYVLSS